jgi:hypothetical protein
MKDLDLKLGSYLCPICGGEIDVRTNDGQTTFLDYRDCQHNADSEEEDQMFRDDVVAEYTGMAGEELNTEQQVVFDRLNEAIRDSINIPNLRRAMAANHLVIPEDGGMGRRSKS